MEKSRIDIQDVKAENGELNLMQHISWRYDKLPHMLISGDTGSGKTIFLLIVIKALLESGAVLHLSLIHIWKNPYSKRIKKQVTINLDGDVIDYFKAQSESSGIPYQTLIRCV